MPAATPMPATTPIQHMGNGRPVVISWIQMVDADAGWAAGGEDDAPSHVLRTQDGGATWRDVTPPEPAAPPDPPAVALVFALDARRAWAVFGPVGGFPTPPAPVVWRTSDGGETWLPGVPLYTRDLSEMFAPSRFFFLDETHGWLMVVLGAGMSHEYIALYRTLDGGLTWARLLDPFGVYIQSFTKTGMAFSSPEDGWVTRDSYGVQPGFLLDITHDGGLTWEERVMDPPEATPGFLDAWACGAHSPRSFSAASGLFGLRCMSYQDFVTTKDYLYSTEDQGATWTILASPGGALQFLNSDQGWALGSSISWTDSGGRKWEMVKRVAWEGQFSFVDGQDGWAVARSSSAIALVRTTDGGATWEEIRPVIGP
jgi:photosystem II stability/assembly factor-like uncharacterized protein